MQAQEEQQLKTSGEQQVGHVGESPLEPLSKAFSAKLSSVLLRPSAASTAFLYMKRPRVNRLTLSVPIYRPGHLKRPPAPSSPCPSQPRGYYASPKPDSPPCHPCRLHCGLKTILLPSIMVPPMLLLPTPPAIPPPLNSGTRSARPTVTGFSPPTLLPCHPMVPQSARRPCSPPPRPTPPPPLHFSSRVSFVYPFLLYSCFLSSLYLRSASHCRALQEKFGGKILASLRVAKRKRKGFKEVHGSEQYRKVLASTSAPCRPSVATLLYLLSLSFTYFLIFITLSLLPLIDNSLDLVFVLLSTCIQRQE